MLIYHEVIKTKLLVFGFFIDLMEFLNNNYEKLLRFHIIFIDFDSLLLTQFKPVMSISPRISMPVPLHFTISKASK